MSVRVRLPAPKIDKHRQALVDFYLFTLPFSLFSKLAGSIFGSEQGIVNREEVRCAAGRHAFYFNLHAVLRHWYLYCCDFPARRKRHIACDELFHFITKLIARSFCCSSLPNRTRCVGLRLGSALWAAVFALVKISVLTVLSTWWQSSLCDHVFLCLRQKRRHPPAPLLFLFKSNPLRRASIWILIQTDSHCIFF